MPAQPSIPLAPLHLLERTSPSKPAIGNLDAEIAQVLAALAIPPGKLRGRRIGVTAGSRGIANLREAVRAACGWLGLQGARAFVFPAMGSHGGATAEGQRAVLASYGVTPDFVGAEVVSSMETVSLGQTPEGFEVFMDRAAYEADGILALNRIKPHTSFSGKIESGLIKMLAVGMGKIDGAREFHRLSRRHGWELVLRAMAAKALATGRILAGVGLIENEMHELCAARAALPQEIAAVEEAALLEARALVPRLPVAKLDLLIVNEIGKNISGTGMDTKVIGRGVSLPAGEGPEIRLIYVRDLTAESGGNAIGVGLADLIHERVYRRADLEKTYINVRTSLNPPLARLPMYFPSDREVVEFALASLGTPAPSAQRVAWIRNTQLLDRMLISAALSSEVADLEYWKLSPETHVPQFDLDNNFKPAL